MKNSLEYNKYIMHVILTELMAGRTFFPGYYEKISWSNLSRGDRVICILQDYFGNHELGEPKGFEEVKENISKEYLDIMKK